MKEIPKDKYVLKRFKEGIGVNIYCDDGCKGRAGTLRKSVKNNKYMPKNLDEIDKKYIKRYLLELNPPLSVEEMNG